jgi:hypothetical protein
MSRTDWQGSYLFVADSEEHLLALDIGDPAAPRLVGDLEMVGSNTKDVFVAGDLGCVAVDWSIAIITASHPETAPLIGRADTPGIAMGATSVGRYAYVADWTSGVQVVDLLDSAQPQIVGNVPVPYYALDVLVSNGHVFVAAGPSGLLVLDASEPAAPVMIGALETGGNAQTLAMDGEILYVMAGTAGLLILDVSDPANPRILSGVDTPGTGENFTLEGTYAFVADAASGLQVIDVSDPEAPVIVSSFWTIAEAVDVAVEGAHAYVAIASPDTQGILSVDIQDPWHPGLLHLLETSGNPGRIDLAHGTLHAALGDLQVFLIDEPGFVRRAWFTDLPRDAKDVRNSGGRLLVSDGEAGLLIYPADCPSPADVAESDGAGARGSLHAFPNPSGRDVVIRLLARRSGAASLGIYDVGGREVRRIATGRLEAGSHDFHWDGRSASGVPVPAGVYFVKARTPEGSNAIRQVIAR